MNATETIFRILKEIRKAKGILSEHAALSSRDMIYLSAIYNNLLESASGTHDLLLEQLAMETNNDKRYMALSDTICSECKGFLDIYESGKSNWDEQCSRDSLWNLVKNDAEKEYAIEIKGALQEMQKRDNIFKKYNDITRLLNSMDCRPDNVEEDKTTLETYCKELSALVNHPINLDSVQEEHDSARAAYKEMQDKLAQLKEASKNRAFELLGQMEDGVVESIADYAYGLVSLFSNKNEVEGKNPEKRRPGRPSKLEVYENAGIHDFETCFQNPSQYQKIHTVLMDYEDLPINGTNAAAIYEVLRDAGYIKMEITSKEDFTDYMIKAFPIKFKLQKGNSVYSSSYLDLDGYKKHWKDKFGIDNELN